MRRRAATHVATTGWPGPHPHPLLGWQCERLRWSRDPVGYLMRVYATFGAVSAWSSKLPRVFAFGPEQNEQLTLHRTRFVMLPPSRGTEGHERRRDADAAALTSLRSGLLSLDGSVHRQHRRVVSPAFRRQDIEQYRDAIVIQTERMLDGWRLGNVIDLERAIRRLVHRLALRTVLDVDDGSSDDRIARLIDRFVEMAPRAMVFPVALPSTHYSTLLRIARDIVVALEDAIAQKRARPSAASVLGVMVRLNAQHGPSLTDRELIAEAYNVLCHETTASALTWTLLLLAEHPSESRKVVEELRGALGGGAPSAQDLERLPVLDHVVKESLRLLPPAPFLRRFLAEPCEFAGRVAPAKASVFFSQYVTHRMPGVFGNACRFVPDRWETCQPTAYEYFPFGIGAHNCVAGSFAIMEMKIVLAMVVQRYHAAPPAGTRVDYVYQLSLRPRNGLPIVVGRQTCDGGKATVDGTFRNMLDLS